MANLCIIPARGGSKRIPKKNIREFCGRPIISYVLRAARQSGCFGTYQLPKAIYVSTDSDEIADIGEQYGSTHTFFRKPETATDDAILSDVISEVLEDHPGEFENVCTILPTAALITAELIKESLEILNNRKDTDQVIALTKFGYPIQRALQRIDLNFLKFREPQYSNELSQNLLPTYHDAGMFYWMRVPQFLAQRKIILDRCVGVEVPETKCQDIDTEEDWKLAELKFKALKNAV